MKRLMYLVGIILISFVLLSSSDANQIEQCPKDMDMQVKKEILDGHVSIMVDGNKAQLKQEVKSSDGKRYVSGSFKIDIENNKSTKGTVTIMVDVMAQLQNNNKEYCKYLIPFAINYGGSKTFWHIGLFSIDTKYHQLNLLDEIALWDQIKDVSVHVDKDKKWASYSKYKQRWKKYFTFDDNLQYFTTPVLPNLMKPTVNALKKYAYYNKNLPEIPAFNIEGFFFLGYSNDGKIAYVSSGISNEAGMINARTVVQDLITDKIVWEHSFNSGENPPPEVSFENYWLKNYKLIVSKLKISKKEGE